MPESSPNTASSTGAQAADDRSIDDQQVRRYVADMARAHALTQDRAARRLRRRIDYILRFRPYTDKLADHLEMHARHLRQLANEIEANRG